MQGYYCGLWARVTIARSYADVTCAGVGGCEGPVLTTGVGEHASVPGRACEHQGRIRHLIRHFRGRAIVADCAISVFRSNSAAVARPCAAVGVSVGARFNSALNAATFERDGASVSIAAGALLCVAHPVRYDRRGVGRACQFLTCRPISSQHAECCDAAAITGHIAIITNTARDGCSARITLRVRRASRAPSGSGAIHPVSIHTGWALTRVCSDTRVRADCTVHTVVLLRGTRVIQLTGVPGIHSDIAVVAR